MFVMMLRLIITLQGNISLLVRITYHKEERTITKRVLFKVEMITDQVRSVPVYIVWHLAS